jgi:hypothetical protein
VVDHNELYKEYREERGGNRRIVEPSIVAQVRDQAKQDYVCPFCDASRRVNVIYRFDISEGNEVVVEFECRAFKDGKPCGNIETRYYIR